MEDKLITKNDGLLTYNDSGISYMKIPMSENKKIRKEFEDIININGRDKVGNGYINRSCVSCILLSARKRTGINYCSMVEKCQLPPES